VKNKLNKNQNMMIGRNRDGSHSRLDAASIIAPLRILAAPTVLLWHHCNGDGQTSLEGSEGTCRAENLMPCFLHNTSTRRARRSIPFTAAMAKKRGTTAAESKITATANGSKEKSFTKSTNHAQVSVSSILQKNSIKLQHVSIVETFVT
jgi:hypothetical protein